MAGKDQLQTDLTSAIRSRDEVAVATLRMLLAAVQKAEVAGTSHVDLSDDDIVAVVRSEVRKRTEAAELYRTGHRDELAEREMAEADVLRRYLPAEVDDAELTRIVAEEVAKATAAGVGGGKAMGAVVKAVRQRVGVRADGARVAAAVKAGLQNSSG
ncbi:MAG: GatB/YqeY domain-containing protein [Actinobacteria bacterium]|nr:GatB/YqeY domain-containing protein [Actinomycetota bacterium]